MDRLTSTPQDATPTLLLFGATGVTGGYLLRQALADGLSVRAAVRSPDKIPPDLLEHDQLDVMKVDVTDLDAVDRAIAGASMVVAPLGYKGEPSEPILLPFVRQVVRSMRQHGARRLVYQASALNLEPGQAGPWPLRWILRPMLEWGLGVASLWGEHDAIIRYLAEEVRDLDWTVTRPGSLYDGPSRGPLAARETAGGRVAYRDLATFTLDIAQSLAHRHTCPYLGYRGTSSASA